MRNQKENFFASKFHLLNTQENSEEIVWSCSDSSDYESNAQNRSNGSFNRAIKRKRKRANSKKTVANLSNLDITIIDSDKQHEKLVHQSPKALQNLSNINYKSPILTSQRVLNSDKSPVIRNRKENKPTSPVLILKHSPIVTPKVRKKLFNSNVNRDRSVSPVLAISKNNEKSEKKCKRSIDNGQNKLQDNLNESFPSETSVALMEKVKSYFDSYFSSTASQHSISECETSKSSPKSLDNIEIVNSPEKIKNKEKSSSDSLSSNYVQKTKKVKYKKDGLAYRLNTLLKKQNTNTSLWYHERFLAANCKFILPKEEYTAYRIESIDFKYGCYLLKVCDIYDDFFFICINSLYVKDNNLQPEAVLKLYKPYNVHNFVDYKLIFNVCKYECTVIKK